MIYNHQKSVKQLIKLELPYGDSSFIDILRRYDSTSSQYTFYVFLWSQRNNNAHNLATKAKLKIDILRVQSP